MPSQKWVWLMKASLTKASKWLRNNQNFAQKIHLSNLQPFLCNKKSASRSSLIVTLSVLSLHLMIRIKVPQLSMAFPSITNELVLDLLNLDSMSRKMPLHTESKLWMMRSCQHKTWTVAPRSTWCNWGQKLTIIPHLSMTPMALLLTFRTRHRLLTTCSKHQIHQVEWRQSVPECVNGLLKTSWQRPKFKTTWRLHISLHSISRLQPQRGARLNSKTLSE